MKKRPLKEVREEMDSLDYQMLCSQIINGARMTQSQKDEYNQMADRISQLEAEYPRARINRMTTDKKK